MLIKLLPTWRALPVVAQWDGPRQKWESFALEGGCARAILNFDLCHHLCSVFSQLLSRLYRLSTSRPIVLKLNCSQKTQALKSIQLVPTKTRADAPEPEQAVDDFCPLPANAAGPACKVDRRYPTENGIPQFRATSCCIRCVIG